MKKQGDMNDSVGKMPKITSVRQVFEEIIHVTKDKRSHVMLADLCDWLNLKMGVINKLATLGLKLRDENSKYKIRKMYFTYHGQTCEIWEIWPNKRIDVNKGPICKCESLENAEFLLETLDQFRKKK